MHFRKKLQLSNNLPNTIEPKYKNNFKLISYSPVDLVIWISIKLQTSQFNIKLVNFQRNTNKYRRHSHFFEKKTINIFLLLKFQYFSGLFKWKHIMYNGVIQNCFIDNWKYSVFDISFRFLLTTMLPFRAFQTKKQIIW